MPYPPSVDWRKSVFNFDAAVSLKSSPTCVGSIELTPVMSFCGGADRATRYVTHIKCLCASSGGPPWHVPGCFGVFDQTNCFWPRAPAQVYPIHQPKQIFAHPRRKGRFGTR